MSPLFGGKESNPDDIAAVTAEIDRISSMPLSRLAAEVMARGFGPGGPGGPGKPGTIEALRITLRTAPAHVSEHEIGGAVTPAFNARAATAEQHNWLLYLVAEALQALEHASLVRVTWHGGVQHYIATRRGRLAVERGMVERFLGDSDS
jgi:hypothetical protein